MFTVKYRVDGNLEKYKAQLVAKGYTQMYDVDHLKTFAPMAKMNIVRILLSLVANFVAIFILAIGANVSR